MDGKILDFFVRLNNDEILMSNLFFTIYKAKNSQDDTSEIINNFFRKESGMDYYTVTFPRSIESSLEDIAEDIVKHDTVGLREDICKLEQKRMDNSITFSPGFVRFFICQAWLYSMGVKKPQIYKCLECGKLLVRTRRSQKYCGIKCKNLNGQKEHRRREKEQQNDKD